MTLRITVVNTSPRVSRDEVLTLAAAWRAQFRQAAPLWNWRVPSIRVAPAAKPGQAPVVGDGEVPLLIVDNPDVAQALGYHDNGPNGPYSKVFTEPIFDNGGSVFGDKGDPSLSVAGCGSHESLEIGGDIFCNDWADRGRSSVAKELCDPVQADAYSIQVGSQVVAVSNFVLPAWFNPSAPAGERVDYLGMLKAPFTRSKGGYWIEMTDGGVHQVFSETHRFAATEAWNSPGRGTRSRYRLQAQPDKAA